MRKNGSIDCALSPLFKYKQSQEYKHFSPPSSQTYATINTLADTGTTDFLIRSSDIPPHLVPRGPTISVQLPNKECITSLGSVQILIPQSDVVITAHIVRPEKLSHNLSSISQLCVQGCAAKFKAGSVEITDRNGRIILSGVKQVHELLWSLPIPVSCTSPAYSAAHTHSAATSSNLAVHNTHDAEFVQFVHAAFGSPSVSTFHRAVRQGYLKAFPRITARMIRRNPPNSMATAMGHLDRVRQGMASTKPSAPSRPLPVLSFTPEHQDMLDPYDSPDMSVEVELDKESEHTLIKRIRVDEANHSS